jgi:hypothetical protein
MSETLDQRRGGPTATIYVGSDPYPPADSDNQAQISGEGWIRMIRRLLHKRG